MKKENILIDKNSLFFIPKLKINQKYLKEFLLTISPYKEQIKKKWINKYKSVFGKQASLKDIQRDKIFSEWIDIFLNVLKIKNINSHYKDMIKIGRSLSKNNTPIEEVILFVHLLEEILFPIMLKNFKDKKKLGKMIFSNDMLFHHELACLTIAYFYKYKSNIDKLEKTREDLTHMIIHDMKNPVSAIMIASSSILKDFKEKNKMDNIKYIEIINKLGNELWNMINNLLDISRIEHKEFKPYLTQNKIEDILEEIVEEHKPVIEQKNIKIFIQKDNLPTIYIDRNLIKRVIHNLLDNAIKYSPKDSEVNIGLTKLKNEIIFSISDKGPGIHKKDKKRIFEKFAQAEFSKAD